jgi:hypothetical protein
VNRLQAVHIFLGIGALVACIAALFVPWYEVEMRYDFSDSPATTDNPTYIDQTLRYEFLVDEVWASRISAIWDNIMTPSSYDDNYFPTVGSLFEKVGILCYCSLALIAMSTVGAIFASRRVASIPAASAIGLLVGTLLVFSLSIPDAISDDMQRPFVMDVDGLYGSQEGSYVDEYFDYTWKAEWGISSAWWLLVAASLMISGHIVLLIRKDSYIQTMRKA